MNGGKEGKNKKKTSFQYGHEDIIKIENIIDNMSKNKIKSKDDEFNSSNEKNLGSIYFLKKNEDGNKVIEESNVSKIPDGIKNTIFELLKKDVPYEGIRSQTEYEDANGDKKVPSKSVFNKFHKDYLREIAEEKRE